MRVIIAGAGEVGRGVAEALREEKRSVALIDPDPSAINESQSLDCLLVTGSVLSRDSLLRAGINDAEIIVMATNNDEINLLSCAFAKRVYSEQVGDRNASGLTAIAVISNPDLMNLNKGAGPLEKWTRADHIVCASDEIVEQLAAGLLAPSIDEILAFGDNSWISSVKVTSKSALIGVQTSEAGNIFVDLPSIYAISSGDGGGKLTNGNEIISWPGLGKQRSPDSGLVLVGDGSGVLGRLVGEINDGIETLVSSPSTNQMNQVIFVDDNEEGEIWVSGGTIIDRFDEATQTWLTPIDISLSLIHI